MSTSHDVEMVHSEDGRAVVINGDETGTVYGTESMGIARFPISGRDVSYYAGLGHDSEISEDDQRFIDTLSAAVCSSVPVELPHPKELQITRLNVGNTYACNMGCSYCYNELPVKDVLGSESSGGMSPEVGRRMVDQFYAQADRDRPLSLAFIGGEPLLYRAALQEIIEYALQKAEDEQRHLSTAIYTNGTMMTKKVIEWANGCNVSMVVSLDGPAVLNDKYRTYHSGRPTSHQVLRNIQLLMEHGGQTLKRVRAVSQTATDLVALHRYFLDLGFNEIHVQPVYDTEGIHSVESQSAMKLLLEWYMTTLRNGTIVSSLPFETYFEKFITKGRSVVSWYPCTAGLSSLGVGPDGTLYPCHHFLEESDHKVGHVDLGMPEFRDRTKLFQNVNEREPCKSCWAKHACGGECYHRAHAAGQGYTGVIPDACRSRKSEIGMALEAYANLASERPDILRSLALKRYSMITPNSDAYAMKDLAAYYD